MPQGLSCFVACGILPDRGLNPCLLHWQVDSLPLSYRESPFNFEWSQCCCCSTAKSCLTLCNPMDCCTPGFPIPHYLPDFAQLRSIESVMLSNHFIPHCPPLLLRLISLSIRIFSNESAVCIKWPKYWNFSFSISSSDEYLGLISYKIDWFDLLAVQGTLKSLIQHHTSKASILQCSVFLMVQLLHPYMITRKPITVTRWTLVRKVISLLFNVLHRFVTAFLPRSKRLLIL